MALVEHDRARSLSPELVETRAGAVREQLPQFERAMLRAGDLALQRGADRLSSRARRAAASPIQAAASLTTSGGVCPVACARSAVQRRTARSPSTTAGSSSWQSAW